MAAVKFFLYAFLLHIHFIFCTSIETITINQTLKDGNLLISKENNFALGYFSPGNSRYRYLGIWYYKVRKQTVVWVANRNNPINGKSGVLSIDPNGNLILYSNHDQKIPVWFTNVSVESTSTCIAQLLDSGNLVLMEDTSKRILWQSFDYPTDTLLPGMKLGLDRKTGLRRFFSSWRSPDDPGIGEYSLELNPIGFPQVFLYKGENPIWRGDILPASKVDGDIRNYSFIYNKDETFFSYFIVDDSVILTSVLNYLGIHKHLTWHASEGKWKEIWIAPKHQCDTYRHCGIYSKCNPTLSSQIFECDCLPGFEPKNSRDWNILRDGSGGCIRKRQESYKMCSPGEGFLKVEHVKVPDTSAAIWVELNTNSKDCEQECRRNCSCTASATVYIAGKGTGCLVWFGELIDTVHRVDSGHELYVRVDALELAASRKSNDRFLGLNISMVSVLIISVASAWCMVILLVYIFLERKRTRVRDKWKKRFEETVGDGTRQLDTAFFSLSTILAATNDFSPYNKLGQGGFGSVYKGQLANGQEIAVKKLGDNSKQGIDEFKNEIILIAKLQHKNLVKLLGCCTEGEELMLIYEYLSNKSLDLLLFDETRSSILDWRKRFDIIIGIARGILYLHQDSRLKIIHRDLKTSNILLDEKMNPKISDFGVAKIFEGEEIQEKTNKIIGTFGYMSPEYVVFGKFSIKSDVYSYGVILLEIIAGKKNNKFCQEDSSLSLIGHVWELWNQNRILEIVDPSIKESYVSNEVLRCIQIGLLCVQEDEKDRPTMFNILLMLNSDISLPSPKQPSFIFSRSFCNNPQVSLREERTCSINEMTITVVVSR